LNLSSQLMDTQTPFFLPLMITFDSRGSKRLQIVGIFGVVLAMLSILHYTRSVIKPVPLPSRTWFGAGILLAARDDADWYFLLGLDQHTEAWADMGGNREESEGDPLVTACREFVEESLGVIPAFESVSTCLRSLQRGGIVGIEGSFGGVRTVSRYVREKSGSFIQYVVPTIYDSTVPSRFQQALNDPATNLEPVQKEKIKLQWIPSRTFQSNFTKCCKIMKKFDSDNLYKKTLPSSRNFIASNNNQKTDPEIEPSQGKSSVSLNPREGIHQPRCYVDNLTIRPSMVRTVCLALEQEYLNFSKLKSRVLTSESQTSSIQLQTSSSRREYI